MNTDNYLKHPRGVLSWLFTLDHKRIGLMYMVSILAAFLLGGVFAILIRMELMYPNKIAETQAVQITLVPREMFTKFTASLFF
jgi:heme/copper-type cytochrome/quinol oxidase subunit 1